jgi:hypothetical protein
MAEPDVFERRVAVALRAYAWEMPARVDAGAVADRVASEGAHRGWRVPGRLVAVPGIAWILLLAGLLLGLAIGGLAGGIWPDRDLAVVIGPTPSSTAANVDAEATILATTKAHPLPLEAACPPGRDPDVPGPANQERPSASGSLGPMAFDRHAGRIVLAADDGTWTFDVCANVWTQMHATAGPRSTPDEQPDWLVYDVDSDRTVAFTSSGQFWSYDLTADRWTKAGWFPGVRRGWGWGSWSTGAIYHDPSGLIVVYDGATMWAYDVEAATLTEIPQRPDPSGLPGAGMPADTRADVIDSLHYDPSGGDFIGYDPRSDLLVALVRPARPGGPSTHRPADETWTFDPGSGTWRLESSYWNQPVGYLGMVGGPATYDAASGLTLFPDGLAFDGGRRAWSRERFETRSSQFNWCAVGPVFDSPNGRIVCLGGARYLGEGPEDVSAVSAFSSTTGQWRWLLDPVPTASPKP